MSSATRRQGAKYLCWNFRTMHESRRGAPRSSQLGSADRQRGNAGFLRCLVVSKKLSPKFRTKASYWTRREVAQKKSHPSSGHLPEGGQLRQWRQPESKRAAGRSGVVAASTHEVYSDPSIPADNEDAQRGTQRVQKRQEAGRNEAKTPARSTATKSKTATPNMRNVRCNSAS